MKTKVFLFRASMMLVALFLSTVIVSAGPLTPKQDKKGRWGYVDESGDWAIKAKYDAASPFDGAVAIVAKDGQQGLVNGEGKEVLKCKYAMLLKIDSESYFAKDASGKWVGYDVKKNDDYKLSDVKIENVNDSNVIITCTVDLGWLYTNRGRYMKTGMFINKNTGKGYASGFTGFRKLGPNIYMLAYGQANKSKVYTGSGQLLTNDFDGNIGMKGNFILLGSSSSQNPVIATSDGNVLTVVDKANSSYIVKNSQGKYGVIAETLYLKIPFEYDFVEGLDNQGFYVKKDGLLGYAKADGSLQIPCKYSEMSCLDTNDEGPVFIVMSNWKRGIVGSSGTEILPCDYNEITKAGFYDYLFVHKDNTVGLYDMRNNKMLVETGKYSSIEQRTPGPITVVTQNGKEGVLDKNGKLIIPCIYEEITRNNLGGPDTYTVWNEDRHFGICNESGKLIIPCGKYDRVKAFEPYAIIVQNGKKIGAVKYDGTQFAPVVYDDYMNGLRNMAFGKNTMTGGALYVYTYGGKFVTSKAFRKSENWRLRIFMQDYLM